MRGSGWQYRLKVEDGNVDGFTPLNGNVLDGCLKGGNVVNIFFLRKVIGGIEDGNVAWLPYSL